MFAPTNRKAVPMGNNFFFHYFYLFIPPPFQSESPQCQLLIQVIFCCCGVLVSPDVPIRVNEVEELTAWQLDFGCHQLQSPRCYNAGGFWGLCKPRLIVFVDVGGKHSLDFLWMVSSIVLDSDMSETTKNLLIAIWRTQYLVTNGAWGA